MHIEVWQSPPRIGDGRWHWAFVWRGIRAGPFDSLASKSAAVQQAKGAVRGIIRCTHSDDYQPDPPKFEIEPIGAQRFEMTWY